MSYYSRSHPYMGYYDDYDNYGLYAFGGPGYGPPRPYSLTARGGYSNHYNRTGAGYNAAAFTAGYNSYLRGRGRGRGKPVNNSPQKKSAVATNAARTPSLTPKSTPTMVEAEPNTEPHTSVSKPSDTLIASDDGKVKPTARVQTYVIATSDSNTSNSKTSTSAVAETSASASAEANTTNSSVSNENGATAATKVPKLTPENPLPPEITEKFYPNRCDLCNALFPISKDIFIPEKGGLQYMKSTLQSAMHFRGKNHKKLLRMAFRKYCKKHKIQYNTVPQETRDLMRDIPTLPKEEAKEGESSSTEQVEMICKICDMSFTSIQHASQHYAGRNHQRRLQGKLPLRDGYFNPRTQRWQRQPLDDDERRDWMFSRTDKYLSARTYDGHSAPHDSYRLDV